MWAILKSLIVCDLCISYTPFLQYCPCSQDINAFDITPSLVNNKALKNLTYCNHMDCKIDLAALQILLQGLNPPGHVLHLTDRENTLNVTCYNKGDLFQEPQSV